MNRYAYLASGHVIALMEALSKAKVNIHGRESGQVALLTDDRHHRYREFLSLALETGVVRR